MTAPADDRPALGGPRAARPAAAPTERRQAGAQPSQEDWYNKLGRPGGQRYGLERLHPSVERWPLVVHPLTKPEIVRIARKPGIYEVQAYMQAPGGREPVPHGGPVRVEITELDVAEVRRDDDLATPPQAQGPGRYQAQDPRHAPWDGAWGQPSHDAAAASSLEPVLQRADLNTYRLEGKLYENMTRIEGALARLGDQMALRQGQPAPDPYRDQHTGRATVPADTVDEVRRHYSASVDAARQDAERRIKEAESSAEARIEILKLSHASALDIERRRAETAERDLETERRRGERLTAKAESAEDELDDLRRKIHDAGRLADDAHRKAGHLAEDLERERRRGGEALREAQRGVGGRAGAPGTLAEQLRDMRASQRELRALVGDVNGAPDGDAETAGGADSETVASLKAGGAILEQLTKMLPQVVETLRGPAPPTAPGDAGPPAGPAPAAQGTSAGPAPAMAASGPSQGAAAPPEHAQRVRAMMEMVEGCHTSGMTPGQVHGLLAPMIGPEALAQASRLPAEAFVAEILGVLPPTSPLAEPSGRRWLSELHAAMLAGLGAGQVHTFRPRAS